jgi:hypothetical protein
MKRQEKKSKRSRKNHRWKKRRCEILLIIGCTCVALIGGFFYSKIQGYHAKATVNANVLAYEPLIEKYAEQYGIASYVYVIEAMMQQESSGLGTDVMQCSECYYNTEYDQSPGSIEDPEYSIQTGIHYFADCLELAGCRGPRDTNRLKLALQGYNYGHNYINWALERDGGYTEENAAAFSDMMEENLGWNGYGDREYPAHVLRYYQ